MITVQKRAGSSKHEDLPVFYAFGIANVQSVNQLYVMQNALGGHLLGSNVRFIGRRLTFPH